MTMCTVKEIQEAIREDCRSQHDMDSTDIDRVMQTLPFAQEEPFTEARLQPPPALGLQNNLFQWQHTEARKK